MKIQETLKTTMQMIKRQRFAMPKPRCHPREELEPSLEALSETSTIKSVLYRVFGRVAMSFCCYFECKQISSILDIFSNISKQSNASSPSLKDKSVIFQRRPHLQNKLSDF